jgi:ribose-phosphate pyrophosphokinase
MLRLFALGSSKALGTRVAHLLSTELQEVEEHAFDDGERRIRPRVEVDGCDAVVLHSPFGGAGQSVHDDLCRLLFLLGTLRDGAPATLTAVVPYLCYSRHDRRVRPRDPVTTRYVAELLEAVGADRIVTVDVHNPAAFENAYRRPLNVETVLLLADAIAPRLAGAPPVVVSPDAGSVKRAERLRLVLGERVGDELPVAFVEKHRRDHVLPDHTVVGDVAGRTAVIVDDLVSSGTTLVRAARACRAKGATAVVAAATHGAFTANADDLLADPALDHLIVTDTIVPLRLSDRRALRKVEVVSVAQLLADALAGPRILASA